MPADDATATFEAAFRAHVRAVRAYALRRTAPEDAADVVAETFAVAWRRWDDAPADPLPWLLGIARRVLANSRRTSSRGGGIGARRGAEARESAPPAGAGRRRSLRSPPRGPRRSVPPCPASRPATARR